MFRLDENQKKEGKKGPEFDHDDVVVVDNSVNPYVVMFHEPQSFRAEQIRGLRNKLIAMNPDGSSKSLVVTSACQGEGKTVTAINLAMSFAEREHTPVLLVDANMRSGSIEDYLHLNAGLGLADVLMGKVSLEAAIRPTGIRGLSVLGAGTPMAAPSEFLTGQRMGDIYARLKEHYQYSIIDTPAALPTTDASVLSSAADGALLVVRLQRSSRGTSRDGLRTLQELGANVLGVFVTEVRGAEMDVEATGRGSFNEEGSN